LPGAPSHADVRLCTKVSPREEEMGRVIFDR
jgi:hypothetical protein